MTLSEVANAIRAKVVADFPGTPIYVGEFPTDADTCVSVWMDSNAGTTAYFGQVTDPADLQRPIIRVMTRAKKYPDGTALCDSVAVAINRYAKDNLFLVRQFGGTQFMGKDPNGRNEFRQTFRTLIQG